MKSNKIITMFFVFIFGIYPTASFPQSKIFTESEIKAIEDRVEHELIDTKNDPSKKLLINLLTAREFYKFRFYEKSFHYYSNAIALNVDDDKSEAYINRVTISVLAKDKKGISDTLNEAKNYFDNNQKYKTASVDYFLNSIEQSLSSHSDVSTKVTGIYSAYVNEENFKYLLKNKQYEKAFDSINPDRVKNSQDEFHVISYDTLNVLINKQNVSELYCNKEYSKYPNSYAYQIIICGLLNDYLNTGEFSDKKMKRAEEYFSIDGKENKYFLDMVKNIKN